MSRNHHSVYVVELFKEVMCIKRFRVKNPNSNPEKSCFYVGMTGLSPEERFANHKRGYKGNYYVRKYGIGLRPDIYEDFNPMSYEDAGKIEYILASELRAAGHGVWQN